LKSSYSRQIHVFQQTFLLHFNSFQFVVGKSVPTVNFLDRRDLLEFLTGVSESSVWLKSAAASTAATAAAAQGGSATTLPSTLSALSSLISGNDSTVEGAEQKAGPLPLDESKGDGKRSFADAVESVEEKRMRVERMQEVFLKLHI
jgi:hypothetical protein